MVQLPLKHTYECTHTHTHAQLWLRGFTSPRPEQRSMPNFDPSHYLARRWVWGWGDNLWTLTPNPGAWAGPCEDNPVCVLCGCAFAYVWHTRKGDSKPFGGRGRNIFWMLHKFIIFLNVAPTEAVVLKKAAECQRCCPSLVIYLCPLGVNIHVVQGRCRPHPSLPDPF